jgi:hypothetical protein
MLHCDPSNSLLDFLIRLAPFRIPSPRSVHEAHSLLPDGLEHPKFKHRKSGSAIYIICWKSAIQHLTERGVNCLALSITVELAG